MRRVTTEMATASNSSESPVVGGGSAKSRRDRNVKLRSVSKYMLFTINCVTLICGLILFFLGVVLQTQYATYFEFLDGSFYNVSLWCLVVGVIVCLVSFLGIYVFSYNLDVVWTIIRSMFLCICSGLFGSIREDYCTLLAFSIILSLVIAFEICLGVSAFAMAQENRLASTVADKMQESLDNYGRRDHEGVTKGTKRLAPLLRRKFYICMPFQFGTFCKLTSTAAVCPSPATGA